MRKVSGIVGLCAGGLFLLILLVLGTLSLLDLDGQEGMVSYLDRAQQVAIRGGDTECPKIKVKARDYCQEGSPVQACPNPCPGTVSCVTDCSIAVAGFTDVNGDTDFTGSLVFRGCGLDRAMESLRQCSATCICDGMLIQNRICSRNSKQKQPC